MTIPHHPLALAGEDWNMAERIRSAFSPLGWTLEVVGTPQRYVQRLRATREVLQRCSPLLELVWLERNLMPLLVEIDCRRRETFEIVREIKGLYGAIPVIVIGAHMDLAHLAVARLDGADAMFSKSHLDLFRLGEAVTDAMARLRRWRQLIRDSAGCAAPA